MITFSAPAARHQSRRGTASGSRLTHPDQTGKLAGMWSNARAVLAGLVLGAWRPDHDTMMIKVLKNTKGRSGVVVECNFDGDTIQLTERSDRRYT